MMGETEQSEEIVSPTVSPAALFYRTKFYKMNK